MHCRPFRLFVLAVLMAAASGCATLRTDVVKQPSTALAPVVDTPSTRYVHAEVAAHGEKSGFRPLISNTNALMSRIVLTDHAEHSIDLQYYIFANDATGRLVAQRLLAAADRGVRVRILLDDLDIDSEDNLLDALDAHPNIEVRLFNPFRVRNRSVFSKLGQFLLEGRRLNRRMHNKSYIVDGMQAIIGGRNIGDAYFDAGDEIHFRDLDVLVIGPVVPRISSMFDAYWNSDAAFPVTAYRSAPATQQDLAQNRAALAKDAREFAESDYAQAVAEDLPNGPSAERKGEWYWGLATLVADDPDKVDPAQDDHGSDKHKRDNRNRIFPIGPQIKAMLDATTKQALLVSPYFIPGKTGTEYLTELAKRGVVIKVLTNSLAATDEPEVHSGYARYRRKLLEAGLDFFELRPAPGQPQQNAHGTSSGVSLHAKTMVVDHRLVYVGSMNLDPRSQLLNTEMGVIVDCPELAASIERFFDRATSPANAFHVVLDRPKGSLRPKMIWLATDGDKTLRYDSEPDVSMMTKMRVSLMRILPIEGLL
jgi:putative cardiolipin synthase